MPQFDRTGPQGFGPMTGRGFGPCAGGCRGFGFGQRRFFSRKNELAALEEEKKMIEEELGALKEEIQALKDES